MPIDRWHRFDSVQARRLSMDLDRSTARLWGRTTVFNIVCNTNRCGLQQTSWEHSNFQLFQRGYR